MYNSSIEGFLPHLLGVIIPNFLLVCHKDMLGNQGVYAHLSSSISTAIHFKWPKDISLNPQISA